ncbi:SDR family NAD(P)-dependent oxidoreductase [Nocardia alni]|uniref:SDR family NAD(P)-dependent oxidoreductase n=1 Tax=Nocardia alni TaxID=2815723 RepID=UPI001C210CF0|nr:SDR family NAD(P)-dependent oxidoreductase [Nocardia alni]
MYTLVMTGATRGIGRVAIEEILRTDPDLHVVALVRAHGRTEFTEALAEFEQRTTILDADLASIGSIRAATAEITRALEDGALPPLRGIAANAGLQFVDALHETTDGFETTFAVNVLANHLLLRGLESHLRAPSRIVITVSDTHFGDFRHTGGMVPAPRWAAPSTLSRPGAFENPATVAAGRTAYSTSKLAAIYLVHEWARRLPDGQDIVSYNPSLVPGTGLARAASARDRFVNRWLLPALAITPIVDRAPAAGRKLADAILGRTPAPSGAYIDRTRMVPSSDESYDADREHELWDFLDEQFTRSIA